MEALDSYRSFGFCWAGHISLQGLAWLSSCCSLLPVGRKYDGLKGAVGAEMRASHIKSNEGAQLQKLEAVESHRHKEHQMKAPLWNVGRW
jgi:hypothetical protein